MSPVLRRSRDHRACSLVRGPDAPRGGSPNGLVRDRSLDLTRRTRCPRRRRPAGSRRLSLQLCAERESQALTLTPARRPAAAGPRCPASPMRKIHLPTPACKCQSPANRTSSSTSCGLSDATPAPCRVTRGLRRASDAQRSAMLTARCGAARRSFRRPRGGIPPPSTGPRQPPAAQLPMRSPKAR